MTAANLEAIAARHGFSADAAAALAEALRRGGGRQAQFSHPALGGMGQWSDGGGIMIGAMFDHDLKARVGALCKDLADRGVDDLGGIRDPSTEWWPSDLGAPSAVGSQNDAAYAVFRPARRLVVRDQDGIRTYDTGDHEITGVAQRQVTGSHDLAFDGAGGTIRLADLRLLQGERTGDRGARHAEQPTAGATEARRAAGPSGSQHPLDLLERLFDLQRKGVLTAEEFGEKKRDLLARI